MAIDFSSFDYSWVYWPGFEIMVTIYFIAIGIINITYAIKSRKNPEKKDHKKYFINEVATGILWLVLAVIYPFIWDTVAPNDYVKAQLYFHCWDCFTVQMIGWQIYILIAKKNNVRKNRVMTYETWKEIQIKRFHSGGKPSIFTNLKRKMQHLLPGLVVVGFYYLGHYLEHVIAPFNWTVMVFTLFFTASTGITFAFIMNIFDLYRLNKWDNLGQFARGWASGALTRKELDTFTSAAPMVLAFVPFFILENHSILIAICLIAGLSDAAASIVGQQWGKIRSKKSPKTIEGYIAGFVVTYLLVLLTHLIMPFEGVSLGIVHIMASLAAFAFFAVDYLSKYLSDNILNSLACGLALILVQTVATL